MSVNLALVGLGGLIGSIGRYLTFLYVSRLIPSVFPFGTFAVNCIGCLMIGFVYGLSQRFDWLSPQSQWSLFLTVGVCGGYTTFSAFAFENVRLLQNGEVFTFAIYSLASFVTCLVATFAGLLIAKI